MTELLTLVSVVISLACLVLWISQPRLLALLLWPVVFLYPRAMLQGILPLNAGLDDLFIVALGLRLLFYVHPDDPAPPRWFNGAVWVAIALSVMQVASEATGLLEYPMFSQYTIRTALKCVGYVLFVHCLTRTIRTEQDLRRHLVSLMLTLFLAFLTVVACNFYPDLADIWQVYRSSADQRAFAEFSQEAMRSWGSLGSPFAIGMVLCVAIPVGIGLLIHRHRSTALYAATLLMLAGAALAIIIAKSRSAVLGLAVMGGGMVVASRYRIRVLAAVCVLAIIWIGASASVGYDRLEKRFNTDTLRRDLDVRLGIWRTFVENPSPAIIAYGEGTYAMWARLGETAHNGFIDALFVWGIGGALTFAIVIWKQFSWSRRVVRYDDSPLARAIAWGALWSILAAAGAGMTGDPWFAPQYRYLAYFLIVVTWSRSQMVQSTVPMTTMSDSAQRFGNMQPSY